MLEHHEKLQETSTNLKAAVLIPQYTFVVEREHVPSNMFAFGCLKQIQSSAGVHAYTHMYFKVLGGGGYVLSC